MKNIDNQTVTAFGKEWVRFDQMYSAENELKGIFDRCFRVFPWHALPENAVGFDLGCGSGRWAKFVAPRVGHLHCIDPSKSALDVAKRNLCECSNCEFHTSSVDNIPIDDDSMDFGYSIGVLHHVPDTAFGIKSCVRKLKKGAPLLLYLYYNFENCTSWYRMLWRISDMFRNIISRVPSKIKYVITQTIAASIYFPIARLLYLIEKCRVNVETFPLSYYRRQSFYMMRTDALDRFGTPLEQRFSRNQIKMMMVDAGLERITFSDSVPYWCAVGYKK